MNKTEIIDAYKQYLMPTYAPEVAIEKGKGSKVFGVGGTQYYDFTAGIGVHNIGHSHPAVVKAFLESQLLATSFP